jgi:hypothetical protein
MPFIQHVEQGDAMVDKFAATALQKVKDAAIKVSETARDLLANVRPEEMPPFTYVMSKSSSKDN